jgi:hypothetical protein
MIKVRSEFIKANPGLLPADNAMGFISDDGGETYNRCHCRRMHSFLSDSGDLIYYGIISSLE